MLVKQIKKDSIMEAKDLRIGNLVSDPRGNYFVVEALDTSGAEIKPFNNSGNNWRVFRNIYNLKPIPLTEEWLEKLGFEKVEDIEDDGYDFKKKRMGLCHEEDGSIQYISKDIVMNKYLHQTINHVHELQNLYYALTGEELKLKEEKK